MDSYIHQTREIMAHLLDCHLDRRVFVCAVEGLATDFYTLLWT